LVFDLVVGKIVKRAQVQRLEHQQGVYRLAPGPGLATRIQLAQDPLKSRAKFLPRHESIDLDQPVFLRV
jgi:hypothetical protein